MSETKEAGVGLMRMVGDKRVPHRERVKVARSTMEKVQAQLQHAREKLREARVNWESEIEGRDDDDGDS